MKRDATARLVSLVCCETLTQDTQNTLLQRFLGKLIPLNRPFALNFLRQMSMVTVSSSGTMERFGTSFVVPCKLQEIQRRRGMIAPGTRCIDSSTGMGLVEWTIGTVRHWPEQFVRPHIQALLL